MKTIAEIRAALVELLAQIDDDNNYSIFEYYGQQLRIPKGWYMKREGKHTVTYTLVDANNVAYGKVRKTTEGHAWAYVDRDPGEAGYHATQLGALQGLIDRAWGSHDTTR
ncbi:hypothetical protein Pondi_00023 [Escherichia phage Pondi]|nr:hypothetical protein Pondi_00023 [Escherichia phage Pondi]